MPPIGMMCWYMIVGITDFAIEVYYKMYYWTRIKFIILKNGVKLYFKLTKLYFRTLVAFSRIRWYFGLTRSVQAFKSVYFGRHK